MRIDKYIWFVRLFKTRSKATTACKEGKVKYNDKDCKPSQELTEGDTISIKKNGVTFSYKILSFPKNRIGAKLVDEHLKDITPKENIEKFKTIQEAQKQYRDYGTGKPSKKDRRSIEKFKNQ